MNKVFVILLLLLASCSGRPGSGEIIDRSIQFHDPSGNWSEYEVMLELEESRPGGEPRNTKIWIDNSRTFFRMNRNDSEIHGMESDSCFVEKGEVDCDRVSTMRNYYTYLWGLPMKLKDPGAEIDPVAEDGVLNGEPVYLVDVTYENDTWTFYFAKDTYELLAYKFVKKDGSGEYIIPDGVYSAGNIRLPDKRSWYGLDSTYLGVDRIVYSESD